MGENSKIEWTDHTWNAWRGCTKVSPGCQNCYAEALSLRFGLGEYKRGVPRIRTSAANWKKPIRWNNSGLWCEGCGGQKGIVGHEHKFRRPRVFCASLSDWLDDEVPIEWLADLLKLIHDTPNLDWLLLTKRPENWHERLRGAMNHWSNHDAKNQTWMFEDAWSWASRWLNSTPPANVWIGTTVEDQQRADERIPEVLKIPARVRFLSCEPLLSAVDLSTWLHCPSCGYTRKDCSEQLDHHLCKGPGPAGIHQVIAGGESGPKARPMHPQWARSLRDQCADASVPFFFKQWGEWLPSDQYEEGKDYYEKSQWTFDPNTVAWQVGKKAAGRLLDGREHNEFPEAR